MADFYNQVHEFMQYMGDLLGRGIKAPSEIYDLMKEINEQLTETFTGFIHPMFIPLLTACVGFALLHKLFRLGDKV